MAGMNRSRRVTTQRILPCVRAAIPAANKAAAAPSTAPLPPPATSCRQAKARPPPGSLLSSAGKPKGRTWRCRACPPSSRSMRDRSSAITDWRRVRALRYSSLQGFAASVKADKFPICSDCLCESIGPAELKSQLLRGVQLNPARVSRGYRRSPAAGIFVYDGDR